MDWPRGVVNRVLKPGPRVVRWLTGLLAVVLLGVAVLTSVHAARTSQQRDLDHELQRRAAGGAAAVLDYVERSRSITLLLAHDAAIAQFEPRARPTAGRAPLSREAEESLQYLERLYPEAIGEACLIGVDGVELARVVRGTIAPESELSPDEAANPFFAPTLRLGPDEVHQAQPYKSADTGDWVVSNSSPLRDDRGRLWGLVHFEVGLDGFRSTALASDRDAAVGTAAVVDNHTGRVLLDSTGPVGRSATLGRPAPAQLRRLVTGIGASVAPVSATVDGRRVAVAPIPSQAGDVNSWSVVVAASDQDPANPLAIGTAPAAIGLAALMLLLLVALSVRASHRELRRASYTDELTGLPNRRMLLERVGQGLLGVGRRGRASVVLLIDLDRFKEVNDTLGHHYGDLLLCEVAARLTAAAGPRDTVARLGGDEFAVLLPDVEGREAGVRLAECYLSELHQPFTIEGMTLSVEASIGMAAAPEDGDDVGALMRAADVAMYEAKDRRGGLVVYDRSLEVDTPSRLTLLGDLRRALRDDELVMHYQPKVDVASGRVTSVEALVRWQHPERGLLSPADFIPVVESTGIILPLTMRTLDLSVAQAKRWSDAGTPVQVAVNLSPRCLLETDLATAVEGVLATHGLAPGLLRLEITESTIMADPVRALATLTRLYDAGVRLSLDDFGTGYSSMAYLKQLPVDELKIDRSFVADMVQVDSDGVLVRSSIDLGHNLGLDVVAEGVEDAETLDRLAELGCDLAQGYLFARPMPACELDTWLGEQAVPAAELHATPAG